MKQQEAKYDVNTQSGTYSDKVHHGEVKRNAKFDNDAPPAIGQKLDGAKGLSGAKNLLAGRFKKKN